MQAIVEEVIRWLGYGALRLLTLGRYRGGRDDDRLSEGAIGLGVVALIVFVGYVVARG